jgi:hypothetical protein
MIIMEEGEAIISEEDRDIKVFRDLLDEIFDGVTVRQPIRVISEVPFRLDGEGAGVGFEEGLEGIVAHDIGEEGTLGGPIGEGRGEWCPGGRIGEGIAGREGGILGNLARGRGPTIVIVIGAEGSRRGVSAEVHEGFIEGLGIDIKAEEGFHGEEGKVILVGIGPREVSDAEGEGMIGEGDELGGDPTF